MSELINIKELNERIERESVFVDTLRTEMGKVIVGQHSILFQRSRSALLSKLMRVRDRHCQLPILAQLPLLFLISRAVRSSIC